MALHSVKKRILDFLDIAPQKVLAGSYQELAIMHHLHLRDTQTKCKIFTERSCEREIGSWKIVQCNKIVQCVLMNCKEGQK